MKSTRALTFSSHENSVFLINLIKFIRSKFKYVFGYTCSTTITLKT